MRRDALSTQGATVTATSRFSDIALCGFGAAAGAPGSSVVSGALLYRPAVAVRVAEEDERVPVAASAGDPDVPVSTPRTIEHAEPGGVSCTMRISSLTRVSWSTAKPTCSL